MFISPWPVSVWDWPPPLHQLWQWELCPGSLVWVERWSGWSCCSPRSEMSSWVLESPLLSTWSWWSSPHHHSLILFLTQQLSMQWPRSVIKPRIRILLTTIYCPGWYLCSVHVEDVVCTDEQEWLQYLLFHHFLVHISVHLCCVGSISSTWTTSTSSAVNVK